MSVLAAVQDVNLPSSTTLPGLFAVVSVGSLLPVLPTGAAVSASAVLASREGLVPTVLVLAVAWIAAVIGDVALYKLASWGGKPCWSGCVYRSVRSTSPGPSVASMTTARRC